MPWHFDNANKKQRIEDKRVAYKATKATGMMTISAGDCCVDVAEQIREDAQNMQPCLVRMLNEPFMQHTARLRTHAIVREAFGGPTHGRHALRSIRLRRRLTRGSDSLRHS
jgi:hypothetical protein